MINSVSGSDKEMTEIKLPGVNIFHLKKAIKFMYTGKLNISMREIKNDHLVWHINNILVNLFKIDAKLNLPTHLLIPPPMADDTDDDNPPGDGPKDCKDDLNNTKENQSNGRVGSGSFQSNSNHASDIENTRQNKQMKEEQTDDDKPKKEEQLDDEKPKIKVEDITGEPEEFVRNVATPDIIDLLDSDDEDCDNNNYFEGGNLDEVTNEHPEDDVDQNLDLNKNPQNQCKESDQSLVYSPRSKGVKRAYFETEEERNSDEYSHEPVTAPSLSAARRKSREGSSSKAAVTHVPVSSILSAPCALESPAVRPTHKDQDAALTSPPKKRLHEDPLESPLLTNDLLQTAMDAIYIPTTTPGPSSPQQPLNIIVPAAVIARKSVPPLVPVLSLPSPPIPIQKKCYCCEGSIVQYQ